MEVGNSMRIGVLTGGGDCPGLNAVIRAVVRKGVTTFGHEFVGFRDGWRGPLEGVTMDLGVKEVHALVAIGGVDTLGVATLRHSAGVFVLVLHKTFDNVLGATDFTFGFDTVV